LSRLRTERGKKMVSLLIITQKKDGERIAAVGLRGGTRREMERGGEGS